jgi:small subunit ribosomal protein S16
MRRPLLVRPARLTERSRRLIPGRFGPARIYRWEKTTVVAVKIKLKRMGKIREPYYRIVVADARTKRDGRAIEEIGKYHPKADPSVIEVNSERVQHWLSVGAQPTDPVRVLLKVTGDWQKFHGEPGAEGTLRIAAPRADKREAFATAASQSQAAKEEKASAKAAPRTARPPKDSAPKDSAPKDSAPKDSAPKDSAPKDSAPKDGPAKDSAPKDGPAKESKAKAKAEAKPDAKPEAPADAEPAVTAEAEAGA